MWRVQRSGAIYEAAVRTSLKTGNDGNQLDALGVWRSLYADVDSDGICDDEDPCVGELDECGVCNGPARSTSVMPDIPLATATRRHQLDALARWWRLRCGRRCRWHL